MEPDQQHAPGTTLRQLLLAIGQPLVEVYSGGDGELDRQVRGVAILDPDDEPGTHPDELVLLVGARGTEAARMLRAAARRGASAAAAKTDSDAASESLRSAASDCGIALLSVGSQARWDQLAALARQALDNAAAATAAGGEGAEDLFSLAQTVATLTGGSVSIEDPASRVLAYSRSDDEVDELRRLSILGWEGPRTYLAKLHEWGVFHRLRAGEDVVRIDEHPAMGIRGRLAIGIRAGSQYLGTIWVQRGREPFAERAEAVLLGASRVAAVTLLRQRGSGAAGARSRHDLIAGLLDGSGSPELTAGHLGLDPAGAAVVLAFDTAGPDTAGHDRGRNGGDTHGSDGPETGSGSIAEFGRAELTGVVSVHANSYRPDALVAAIGSRVYAILPGNTGDSVPASLTAFASEIVSVTRGRTGMRVRAAIGSPAGDLGDVAVSRCEADRVLDAMSRDGGTDVATIADLRGEVLLGETLSLLAEHPELRDPTVHRLVTHDAEHGTELATSLLTYLDALGDVRSAASLLHVHPNTLRHRIRRATEISGIALDAPRERLFCHLQLVLAARRHDITNAGTDRPAGRPG